MDLLKGVMDYIKFRNANPIKDVMTILSGIGSPQEMVHTDEKWHTENFMWERPNPQKGFLDSGTCRRLDIDSIKRSEAFN